MSLFDRIKKRILSEESEASKRQKEVAQQNREEAARERRRKKFGPENPEGKVKFNKNQNNQNPSSRTNKPKRGSTTFVPGGQGTLPDFDPDSGKIVTDTKGKPLYGTEPPREGKVKTTYTKKPPTQTPIETSGPLFDQQPRDKKGFRSFVKSPAYYARQREKTDAGRKRYDFVPDKQGKFDFNPETKKANIEKYARRMLSRKQIDSKSNVPINLTPDDLAKAERDARSKYGGIDMKKARKKYTPNAFRQGQKEFDKIFKNIRTGEGGTGESDPWSDKKNNQRKPKTPPKVEPPKVEKPVKQFNGKSFDAFMKDSERKRKQTLQSVKNIKVDPVDKFGSKVSVGNQIPYTPKRIPNPERVKKIKDYRAMLKSQPKYLRNISKVGRKVPGRYKALGVALSTLGAIYGTSKLVGSGTKPKTTPLVAGGDKDNFVPVSAKINLSKGTRPTFYTKDPSGSGKSIPFKKAFPNAGKVKNT